MAGDQANQVLTPPEPPVAPMSLDPLLAFEIPEQEQMESDFELDEQGKEKTSSGPSTSQ